MFQWHPVDETTMHLQSDSESDSDIDDDADQEYGPTRNEHLYIYELSQHVKSLTAACDSFHDVLMTTHLPLVQHYHQSRLEVAELERRRDDEMLRRHRQYMEHVVEQSRLRQESAAVLSQYHKLLGKTEILRLHNLSLLGQLGEQTVVLHERTQEAEAWKERALSAEHRESTIQHVLHAHQEIHEVSQRLQAMQVQHIQGLQLDLHQQQELSDSVRERWSSPLSRQLQSISNLLFPR